MVFYKGECLLLPSAYGTSPNTTVLLLYWGRTGGSRHYFNAFQITPSMGLQCCSLLRCSKSEVTVTFKVPVTFGNSNFNIFVRWKRLESPCFIWSECRTFCVPSSIVQCIENNVSVKDFVYNAVYI